MSVLLLALGLLLGLPLGAAAWWFLTRHHAETLKSAFALLSQEQLEKNTQHLLTLAQEKLGDKQEGISQNLTVIKTEIGEKITAVTALMQSLEKDRESKYATLAQSLTHTTEHLTRLQSTTADLTSALSNSRTRGQWGERMAEDVLRLAGLQENLNYRKQSTLVGSEGTRRPDFTFLLPDNRVLHMDVKFPLDDYQRYHKAESDAARADAAKKFLAATRAHIKSTAARSYASGAATQGAANATELPLDDIIIFIPNEQVYAFLLENDPQVLMDAVAQKVILCSPTTLLAVLAVIRQAMQGYALNRQAQQVYGLLSGIREQWEKYTESMARIGDKLTEAQKAFDATTTTRSNMLDRQFAKLETIGGTGPEQSTLLESTPLPPSARVN